MEWQPRIGYQTPSKKKRVSTHGWRWEVKLLSHFRLIVTPWTVVYTRLLRPWHFPGKSTGVGCHFLLQEIFPTQGMNPGLPSCRKMLLPSEPLGKSVYVNHPKTNQPNEATPMLSSKPPSTLSCPRTMILFYLSSCKDKHKNRVLTICVISLV